MSGLPTPSLRAAVVAVLVVLVVAGGGFLLGFGGTDETVGVSLANDDDAAHDLAVRITYETDTLVNRSATLDPDESRSVEFQNPDAAGDARVLATLDGRESQTTAVRVGPGSGIRRVTVEVTAEGTLSVYAGRT